MEENIGSKGISGYSWVVKNHRRKKEESCVDSRLRRNDTQRSTPWMVSPAKAGLQKATDSLKEA